MSDVSDQIIKKYCGQIEERVAACRDKAVAAYLKQNICSEIKRQTNDQTLLNDISIYIDNLIDARFCEVTIKDAAMKPIDKTIPIEELITKHPFSVHYLMKKGIKCIVCGEPIWGTLEDAVKEKGLSDRDLNRIVEEINAEIE